MTKNEWAEHLKSIPDPIEEAAENLWMADEGCKNLLTKLGVAEKAKAMAEKSVELMLGDKRIEVTTAFLKDIVRLCRPCQEPECEHLSCVDMPWVRKTALEVLEKIGEGA